MLNRLHIRNFAVVEQLELEFAPGMTVFTGETGAGLPFRNARERPSRPTTRRINSSSPVSTAWDSSKAERAGIRGS